ncbi:MAG TPA: hypothetical protein VN675_00785 [Burkholderiales bacterium]|nr:hypothetical protein [Burkholderiales bacterium]
MGEQKQVSWLAIVGWSFLAGFAGLIAGSVLGYVWSNAQDHTTATGYALRGDHRAMIVIGHAVLSGFATAVVAALAVLGLLVRRRLSKKGQQPTTLA